ncbi:MAG: hypothetical protein U9R27_01215 [Campylobacterota bacterium]|nr:hypothetical protein [Campylobacterota bacterium]
MPHLKPLLLLLLLTLNLTANIPPLTQNNYQAFGKLLNTDGKATPRR